MTDKTTSEPAAHDTAATEAAPRKSRARGSVPPAVGSPPPDAAPGMVRVKCIVHTGPWVDNSPMEFKEERLVSPEDAAILEANDQVVVLG